MTLSDILRRSWHNIGRAKVRVGLTAAALAIGAATMTLALAITQGAQDTIQQGFGNFKNTFVSIEGLAVENNSATGVQTSEEASKAMSDARNKSLGLADVEKFKAISGVSQVIPLSYYSFAEVELAGKSYQAPPIQPYTPVEAMGELVAGKPEDLKGDTVIIPERYVKQAGATSPKNFIGQKLTFIRRGLPGFFGRPATPDKRVQLTVVGVTKSDSDAGSARSEYAYLAPETMGALVEAERETKDPKDVYYDRIFLITAESQTESIKENLTRQGYDAVTRQDSIGEALAAVNAVRTALLVFAGIAIFTAIFGVVNTQLMSVLERTREIGIMKALGLSSRGVLLMFSIEAGWIGLIGSLVGTLIAIPFAVLLDVLGGSTFHAPITPLNFLIVVIVLVGIAMLSGLLPARRAAKLDPVEALRSE